MDIILSKLFHLASLPALVIIPGSFWAALITAICLSRGCMAKTTARRLFRLWLCVVIPWALLLGGTALLLHVSANQKLDALIAQKPSHLLISSEGKTNEISDRAVIDEFFHVATHSQKVMAHHSHPVSQVTLLFPETGYIYSLGRDSQYPNEFWFGWAGTARSGQDRLHVGAGLGQLNKVLPASNGESRCERQVSIVSTYLDPFRLESVDDAGNASTRAANVIVPAK